MQKKLFAIMAALVILPLLLSGIVYTAQNITIYIDGWKVESDVAPQLVDGRTLVPLRAIAEHFGAEVQWDQASMSVEIITPQQKFLEDYAGKGMYIRQAADILPLFNAGSAVILDVRSPALRSQSYITGSKHIPITELLYRIDELPTDKTIAVYCVKNINASYAVAILNMQGYHAYLLENGMAAWEAAGGQNTICRR